MIYVISLWMTCSDWFKIKTADSAQPRIAQ